MDVYFFAITLFTGIVYAYMAISRRTEAEDYRTWVYFWRDVFFIFLTVMLFRGFIVDWFRIPSGSMLPTLHVGDYVLVSRSEYGLRFLGVKLSEGEAPQRGDVIVFLKPPENDTYVC